MGNCLDGLKNSARGRPHNIEDGQKSTKIKHEKELDSVLLNESSREDKSGNNKQSDSNYGDQNEDTNVRSESFHPTLDKSPRDSDTGQVCYPSLSSSTVVRRLFDSPRKINRVDKSSTKSPFDGAEDAASVVIEASHGDDAIHGGDVGGATVDINRCNEHQLLVIGFSIHEARAVIKYRCSHGRFQNTTDVKAVPGLSEETWLKVKSRLTLVPSAALHFKSSHPKKKTSTFKNTVGQNGIKSQEDEKDVIVLSDDDDVQIIDGKSRPTIDLNCANVHQLCCIGMPKSLAQEIINYRVAKRGFNLIDEIKNVPGMSEATFSKFSQRLTLSQVKTKVYSTPRKRSRNFPLMPSPISKACYSPGKDMFVMFGTEDTSPSKQYSAGDNGASPDNTLREDVPSSDYCTPRQIAAAAASVLPRSPASSTKGQKSIRIATWNLQCFSNKKVSNVGVLETVCTTILKHGFDIVVVQEIGSEGKPLQRVCDELNEPTTSAVKTLGSSRKKWRCDISPEYTGKMFEGVEYNGFLWNEQAGIHFIKAELLNSFKDVYVRKPYAGNFKVRDWSFVLISLHLRAEGGWGKNFTEELQNEVGNLPLLVTSMEALKVDVILLGDFNMEPSASCFESLRSYGYLNVFSSDEPTNISAANPDGSRCYDNIWISEELMNRRCKGNVRNVVRRNLQHPMISDRKSPGKPGTVSDHCPVWAGFTK